MSLFEQGEVRVELVQELRELAQRRIDVPELVDSILSHLGLKERNGLFPVLVYFRAAFCISLREALPLREWLDGKDRSEVDLITIPAMQRNKDLWHKKEAVPA
jgi:hypothetical protein